MQTDTASQYAGLICDEWLSYKKDTARYEIASDLQKSQVKLSDVLWEHFSQLVYAQGTCREASTAHFAILRVDEANLEIVHTLGDNTTTYFVHIVRAATVYSPPIANLMVVVNVMPTLTTYSSPMTCTAFEQFVQELIALLRLY
eukprot:5301839-Prymnesium_polylepis.1